MIFCGIDTALVNAGLSIVDDYGVSLYSSKPYPKKQWEGEEDAFFAEHTRIVAIRDWILTEVKNFCTARQLVLGVDVFLSMEDYLLTGYQRSYKTAELVSLIKNTCYELNIPYCMVHPSKTKKYVVKKKEVTKTEIISYVKTDTAGKAFINIDPADYSDVADAYVIARVGRLAWLVKNEKLDPKTLPVHWYELLFTPTATGILQKPGLYVQRKNAIV